MNTIILTTILTTTLHNPLPFHQGPPPIPTTPHQTIEELTKQLQQTKKQLQQALQELAQLKTKPEQIAAPNAGIIKITTHPDATITIDGQPTTSTGPHRTYTTPPLTTGYTYQYYITAHKNGHSTTTKITIKANETKHIQLYP